MVIIFYPDHIPCVTKLAWLLKMKREIIIYLDIPFADIHLHSECIFLISKAYIKHMQCFVWRKEAIHLVLCHVDNLKIPEKLKENLRMILWYLDSVFDYVIVKTNQNITNGTSFHSETFDHYLVIKYWIYQHEPRSLTAFRKRSTINLNHWAVGHCGECSPMVSMAYHLHSTA